jgi:hypothetical protein
VMTRQTVLWRVGAILAGVGQLSCGSMAHDFVQAKTGVDVGPEIRLCTNGVLFADSSCRPSGLGGPPWVKNDNFDVCPMQGATADWKVASRIVKEHYLGAPFVRGRLQPRCKPREPSEGEPTGLPIMARVAVESIDLGAKLDKEVENHFALEAIAKLRKAGIPVEAGMEARFRDSLRRIVREKVKVELLWFVGTYTGGRAAIESDERLAACHAEVRAHASDGAQYVTGVAGFVVLSNEADVSINSTQTVAAALTGIVSDPAHAIDVASLSADWEKTVGDVIRVNAVTKSETQTIYPLWVQVE